MQAPDSARHSPRGIFCSRTLNLRSISAIGYDMDYTLMHYNVMVLTSFIFVTKVECRYLSEVGCIICLTFRHVAPTVMPSVEFKGHEPVLNSAITNWLFMSTIAIS